MRTYRLPISERVELVIRNLMRRKYNRLCSSYANEGFDLFFEENMARDLGVSTEDLERLLPIKRQRDSLFGGKPLAYTPTRQEVRGLIPKLIELEKSRGGEII